MSYFLLVVDASTLSGFPMEITECRNLEKLRMRFQGFVSIPPEIGNLTNLSSLDFNFSPNLLSLPGEIGNLSQLTGMLVWLL